MRSRPRSRIGSSSVVLAGLDVVSVVLILRALVSGVVALPRGFTRSWVVILATLLGLLPVALLLSEAARGKA
jgi:hypothetical protein